MTGGWDNPGKSGEKGFQTHLCAGQQEQGTSQSAMPAFGGLTFSTQLRRKFRREGPSGATKSFLATFAGSQSNPERNNITAELLRSVAAHSTVLNRNFISLPARLSSNVKPTEAILLLWRRFQ
jgi:hypothetical protein